MAAQLLLESVIMIQILAHLPLAGILLPANAWQAFDLIIGIVSFDYFQPMEYLDIYLTEMPSWSESFEWLGYESINFLEGIGSIILIALALMLRLVLIPICTRLKHSRPCC